MIRLAKFHNELVSSGIPIDGVSGLGERVEEGVYEDARIDFTDAATIGDRASADAIKGNHDSVDYEAQRQQQADTDMADIPGYATWTAGDATSWIDSNVTADASVKTALKAIARMLIALRNKTRPDLEGS